ncbi:GNAT family N-acetyltransferase [Streptomyces sp. NPDC059740]|uniref:GNAT family N-acetyltransferase n=1 Tax=Streptomyces sp. NPDC059740 TaxID=3346926 RepID=UPI003668A6C4
MTTNAAPGTARPAPEGEFTHDPGSAPLLAAYDAQVRGFPQRPPAGVRYEVDGPVTRTVGQFRGLVTGPPDLGVTGAALDALIARQRDFFAARGEAVEWKTRGHDRPADLVDRLRAAGFTPEERETVLVAPTAAVAAAAAPPRGVLLRRVEAEADLRRIAAMESAVWGVDMGWLAEDLAGRLASAPENIAVLVAEAEDGPGGEGPGSGGASGDGPSGEGGGGARGRLVSAAWLVFREGTEFASLWGGSTLPAWRGRGVYRALVAARAGLAAARGVRYLQVDASDDSAPILRRLGFHAVTTTTPYVWSPPGAVTAG